MAQGRRGDRLAREVQAALAEILLEGLKDPRVGSVSITGVRVSDDLGSARVTFVPLGGHGDPKVVAEGLAAATGWIRHELGRRVSMKRVPDLAFHPDTALEPAMEVMNTLDRLSTQRTRAG